MMQAAGKIRVYLNEEGKEYMYRVREEEVASFQDDQGGLACHKTRRHVISTNEQKIFDAILRVFANSEERLMRIEILRRLGRAHDSLRFLGERNPLTGIRLQMIRMTKSRYARIVAKGDQECGPTFALTILGQERWEKIKGVSPSVESMTAAVLDRVTPLQRERTLADRMTALEAKARKNYALCQRLRGNLESLAKARQRLREMLESLPNKE